MLECEISRWKSDVNGLSKGIEKLEQIADLKIETGGDYNPDKPVGDDVFLKVSI